jgi:hypothetical protein
MTLVLPQKLPVRAFAERFQKEMKPLSDKFSFFSAGLKLNEEDEKEFIYDPVESLPPMVRELLPDISIVLVPQLEASSESSTAEVDVILESDSEAPTEAKGKSARHRIWQNETHLGDSIVLTFAVSGCDSGEYHYRLFHAIAEKVAERAKPEFWKGYQELLRDELRRKVHGETDEDSWKAKDALLAASLSPWRQSRSFDHYARVSLIDCLTLYLHGLCCDIDIDPGPRQIQSRELRKRLEWLYANLGAPENYAILPEQKRKLANRS